MDFSCFNIERSAIVTAPFAIAPGDITIPEGMPLVQSFFDEKALNATFGFQAHVFGAFGQAKHRP